MEEAFVLLMLITFPVIVLATSSGLAISLPGCPD
jgi:type III secretory pathway component EscS